MNELEGIFIFCEGDHDLAFCHLVMKHIAKAERMSIPDTNAPSPVGNIVKTRLSKQLEGEDCKVLRYRHAYKLGCKRVFLYKTEGKGQYALVKELIASVESFLPDGIFGSLSLNSAGTAPVRDALSKTRYMFVYDNDEKNLDSLCRWWRKIYSEITECPSWSICNEGEACDNGRIYGNKAVYGWCVGDESNTLEDVLLTFLPKLGGFPVERCMCFIDEIAQDAKSRWNWVPRGEQPKEVSAAKERKNKAAITISGQNHRPGGSLAAIIQDCLKLEGTKNDDANKVQIFMTNAYALRFWEFFKAFIGLEEMQI